MKTKSLWKISIVTTSEAEDAVGEMLGSVLNQPASTYLNVETGKSTVSVFCETRPASDIRTAMTAGLSRIQSCGLATGPGKISIARIRREDWAESWKRHFKPIEISRALLIKPSWNKKRPRKNQALIILDPGLSFGTGQHPTTAFCLREIARCQKIETRQSFLDIGSGSGILAIAAAKLGYTPVDAFDFDPDAVEIARENARVNGVAGKIRFWRGDAAKLRLRPARRYDLICANLISPLLITARRRIAAQLNRGGTLVLAGILKSEFASVENCFAEIGFKPVSGRAEKGWRSGSFQFA